MLRHAMFVLVLVGAAFAGGAAINGPGLAWLQRNLIGGPTIIVDGSAPGHPARPSRRFPSAGPSLEVAPGVHVPAAKPAGPVAAAAPAQAAPADSPASPAARLLQLPEPAGPDLASAAARPAPPVAPMPATPADGPTLEPALDLPPDLAATSSPAKADPVARLASATTGGLDPASAAGPAGPDRDWVEVRQRLKALGVARYAIDAETDGRVKFSCVIPMDGLRAVGHHFEAEGDDEFQAAEATIRRITLWRATEPARPGP